MVIAISAPKCIFDAHLKNVIISFWHI